MASMDELKALGKAVMNAAVDAELLGLVRVTEHLSMAFDEVAREGVKVRAQAVEGKSGKFGEPGWGKLNGS